MGRRPTEGAPSGLGPSRRVPFTESHHAAKGSTPSQGSFRSLQDLRSGSRDGPPSPSRKRLLAAPFDELESTVHS